MISHSMGDHVRLLGRIADVMECGFHDLVRVRLTETSIKVALPSLMRTKGGRGSILDHEIQASCIRILEILRTRDFTSRRAVRGDFRWMMAQKDIKWRGAGAPVYCHVLREIQHRRLEAAARWVLINNATEHVRDRAVQASYLAVTAGVIHGRECLTRRGFGTPFGIDEARCRTAASSVGRIWTPSVPGR